MVETTTIFFCAKNWTIFGKKCPNDGKKCPRPSQNLWKAHNRTKRLRNFIYDHDNNSILSTTQQFSNKETFGECATHIIVLRIPLACSGRRRVLPRKPTPTAARDQKSRRQDVQKAARKKGKTRLQRPALQNKKDSLIVARSASGERPWHETLWSQGSLERRRRRYPDMMVGQYRVLGSSVCQAVLTIGWCHTRDCLISVLVSTVDAPKRKQHEQTPIRILIQPGSHS